MVISSGWKLAPRHWSIGDQLFWAASKRTGNSKFLASCSKLYSFSGGTIVQWLVPLNSPSLWRFHGTQCHQPQIWVSNCPFATIIWKLGGGTSRITDCGERSRIYRMSISGIALDNTPVFIGPSMVNSPKSIGKYSIRFLHLRFVFVENGMQSGSPSLAMNTIWNCFSSSSDCGIFSSQFSGFRIRGGLGTPDGLYLHSFTSFRLALSFSCYGWLEDFRGLICCNAQCHLQRTGIVGNLGYMVLCPVGVSAIIWDDVRGAVVVN